MSEYDVYRDAALRSQAAVARKTAGCSDCEGTGRMLALAGFTDNASVYETCVTCGGKGHRYTDLELAAIAFIVKVRDRGLGRFMPDEMPLLNAMAAAAGATDGEQT